VSRPAIGIALVAVVVVAAIVFAGSFRRAAGEAATPSGAPHQSNAACGTVSTSLVPSCGAWLGIWPRTTGDGTMSYDLAGNLAETEQRLGKQVTLVSRYYGWGELPPDRLDEGWRDSGHLLLVDLRARNFQTREYTKWGAIADGSQDDYLRQVAAKVKAFGSRLFFSFNQEPEQELEAGDDVAGTAADFAAAYRHIHDVFQEAHATNVVWVWWVMGYMGNVRWYPSLYPGDKYVDWVSYDPYDYNQCKRISFKTPTETVSPFLDWLAHSGIADSKPVMLSEFGSYGTNRGSWYREFGRVIKTMPRIKAVVAFNSDPGSCDTRVTASRDNWEGFTSLAKDPFFNPSVFNPSVHTYSSSPIAGRGSDNSLPSAGRSMAHGVDRPQATSVLDIH
jgi:hypothetical protein